MSETTIYSGEENKTERIVVRLSPTVLRDLKKILESEGDSISSFLRRCAVEKVNNSKVKNKEVK